MAFRLSFRELALRVSGGAVEAIMFLVRRLSFVLDVQLYGTYLSTIVRNKKEVTDTCIQFNVKRAYNGMVKTGYGICLW